MTAAALLDDASPPHVRSRAPSVLVAPPALARLVTATVYRRGGGDALETVN